MEVYNKNRDKNNSLSDEIKEQNAKLKGAPLKDRLLYFKDYYLLTTVIAIAVCAFVVSLVYSMITAPRETAFGAFFYNDLGDSSSTELSDAFAAYMGIDTKKQSVYIDATMSYSDNFNDYESYTSIEKAMTYIASKEVDVIVGDTDTIDYYARCGVLHDVTEILPEDLLEQFSDRLLYIELEDGIRLAAAIDVSDAPKLEEYYYYYGGCEAFLGFVANSENVDTAVAFLRYLYLSEK